MLSPTDMEVEKAFKYRIYPTKKQQELIQKTFGCCRFVYNYYLNMRKESYEKDKTSVTYNMCSKDMTSFQKNLLNLNKCDKIAILIRMNNNILKNE